jgi:hypothetical protein
VSVRVQTEPMKLRDPRWSEPDADAPMEDLEWRGDHPHAEPLRTLLGGGGGAPEAEYARPRRDPIGSAELWRALEGYAANEVLSSRE